MISCHCTLFGGHPSHHHLYSELCIMTLFVGMVWSLESKYANKILPIRLNVCVLNNSLSTRNQRAEQRQPSANVGASIPSDPGSDNTLTLSQPGSRCGRRYLLFKTHIVCHSISVAPNV